ncbi:uracil-DNA glycosylase family protein [Geomonas azotofigens]|uniref:uracil-DNA glycosylase family protein n=1 Tax=Geomonas azotofigens TaxID=2843196 RepID=UPI001C128F51|nr:uracil-DNA glycosylase family protein [Geomonas azotofigens]MBU5613430.1 uracil-DNA glycosylase [Geomonas azotofigens]
MAEMEERELLLRSLKGYLVDLADSGVDELAYGCGPSTVPPLAAAVSGPTAAPAVAAAAGPTAEPAEPIVSAGPAGPPVSAASGEEPPCRQDGDPRARLLFLMTGPGYTGAAGDLLAKIIGAMKLSTDQVCLLSFDAGADADAMARGVAQRLDAVAPEVVVTLGEEATRLVLGGKASLERVRGQWQDVGGRAVMPTLHPELLLEDEGLKRHVWEDMKLVMRRLAGAS